MLSPNLWKSEPLSITAELRQPENPEPKQRKQKEKRERGESVSPRTDSRFAMSLPYCGYPTFTVLKQTGPCGPWHGGGQEPYGRWK